MKSLFHSRVADSERRLRERIFNVLPAASFQMDRLLQLLDIVESDRSPTACVECTHQPRLHLNPQFIAEHCPNDEDLFMLVMHELYHVILGHTRLFPRATLLNNLVFDAVINSMLCQQFRDPVYTQFFQKLNPWDSFPARLLAPPPGWPNKPATLPSGANKAERRAMELLYGENHESTTYLDVFNALTECLPDEDLETLSTDVVLLGDHGGESLCGDEDEKAVCNETLRQVVRKVVEGWPPPPNPIAGRDEGHDPRAFFLTSNASAVPEFLRVLRRLLHRVGVLNPSNSNSPRSWKQINHSREMQTVLPQLRDRQATAWKQITGAQPVFYRGTLACRHHRLEPEEVAHAYLDISGSMSGLLPMLGKGLDHPHQKGEVRLYAFSTVVDAFSPKCPLAKQSVENTYGTDINCVLKHLLQIPRRKCPKRVLIITDGYTGPPQHELISQLKERGVRFYVGLIGDEVSRELEPIAQHIEHLPESTTE